MGAITSTCLRCNNLVSVDLGQEEIADFRCGFCGARQRQLIYPASWQEHPFVQITPVTEEGARCYHHDNASAENLCDDCGRYLCDLCTLAIPMPASEPADFPQQVCPDCFQHRVDEELRAGEWDLFRTKYRRYDMLALSLIAIPILVFPLFFLSVVTVPIALYLLIRNWRICRTPVQHFQSRLLVGLAVGGIILVFQLSFMVFNLVNLL